MSGGNDGSVYSFEILPGSECASPFDDILCDSYDHCNCASIDQLYLSFVKESMINNPVLSNYVLFTTDKSLVYTAFFADFGPLNLGLAYKFCQQLQEALRNRGSKRLLYRVSDHPHQRTNAAVLVCSYLVRNFLLVDT